MAELLPPSERRVRVAWSLGLRPRSGLLVLAGLALLGVASLELWPVAIGWLSDRLALAFGEEGLELAEPSAGSGAGLLVLLGVGLIAVVIVGARRGERRALGVPAEVGQLPGWIVVVLISIAAGLSAAASVGVLAGAARSVDASPDALAQVWIEWVRHGLLGLAAAAVGVGLIEWRLSAWQLWRGLHQTHAQAREEARAARAPRRRPEPDP